MSRPPACAKRSLLTLIEVCYAHGYGPRRIARMIGISTQAVTNHARNLNVRIGTRNPKPPTDPPFEVKLALLHFLHDAGR